MMQGKDLLKSFRNLPEHDQNRLLVYAYAQITALHDAGKSFDSFDWSNCIFENDSLTFNISVDEYFNEEAFQRNLLDFGKVIYCLTTGNKSAESMSRDAGRKIQSNVLREIVLTICGRNDSIEPLLDKLRQPYVDEDTFFNGYTTVDEKEGREAAEEQRRIDEQNGAQEAYEQNAELYSQSPNYTSPKKSWGGCIAISVVMVLCIGGYRAYKYQKEIKHQQAVQQNEQILQKRRQMHDELRKYTYELDLKNGRINVTPKDSINRKGTKQNQGNNTNRL